MKLVFRFFFPAFLLLASLISIPAAAQDTIRTGSNLASQPIRLAAADFKPASGDPQTVPLKSVFDNTLYNDLNNAGIFQMVSKSLAPQATPGSPQEMVLSQWSASPASASMVAFGALAVNNGRLAVYGWLYDTSNSSNPQVLARQYNDVANTDMARTLAHRFADEIISRLGGGIDGICETKIYFVSARSGSKEIWVMDYDGENQHPVTHLGTISLSPRISPDNSKLAYSSLGKEGWSVRMFSFDIDRNVTFSTGTVGGSNLTPAWASDGSKVAFSSSRSGDSEIWVSSPNGSDAHRVTSLKGPNVSPSWNPKTNGQIVFTGGRTGEPQIYIMDQDGTNIQRMTDSGYAVSPSWSPNGGLLTFAWNRKYGPGDPGGQDIYVMDIASKNWLQVTHESGNNDCPSWSPDSRHIVFQRKVGGHTQIWSMLADGTQQRQLTRAGENSMPNWSWK